MVDRIRRIEVFSFYDYMGIEKHLEEMAGKGLLIEKISNWGWVYRRIEPTRLHFSVVYYPKASEFDPEPSEGQRSFYDFCEHTGWKTACTAAQMQVFYNVQDDPAPIETDPVIEVDTIMEAAKKSFLPTHFVLLAIIILNIALFIFRLFNDPIGVLAGATHIVSGIFYLLSLFICMAEVCSFYIWFYKAKKAAERGVFMETHSSPVCRRWIFWCIILFVVYLIASGIFSGNSMAGWICLSMVFYMAALIYIVNFIKQIMKNKNVSKTANRAITIISAFIFAYVMIFVIAMFFIRASSRGWFEDTGQTFDELPLVMEDLMDEVPDGYIRDCAGRETIFLRQIELIQHSPLGGDAYSGKGGLEYEITYIKMPFLYDLCKESLLEARKDVVENNRVVFTDHYEKIDPTPWNALEAYQCHFSSSILDKYILCYPGHIVEISFSWPPTEDNIQIAGMKLAGIQGY